MTFDTCIQLCNSNLYQEVEHYNHCHSYPFCTTCLRFCQGNHFSDFFPVFPKQWALPVLKHHMNKLIQYILLWVNLLSFSVIFEIHPYFYVYTWFVPFLLLSTIPFCKCMMVYLISCFMVTWVRKHVIFSQTDKLAKQSSSYGFVFVKNVDTQKNTYIYTHIFHKDIYHSMDLWDYVVGYIYITTFNIFL